MMCFGRALVSSKELQLGYFFLYDVLENICFLSRDLPRPTDPSKDYAGRTKGNGVLQFMWSLMIFLSQGEAVR